MTAVRLRTCDHWLRYGANQEMETTDIKGAQLNTGAIANAGFVDYRESASGFKNAVKSLEKAQQTLVTCIQDTSTNDW